MTIAIVTALEPSTASPLPRAVLAQLVQHAACAGKTVSLCGCADTRELLDTLRREDPRGIEFLLFDPGLEGVAPPALDAWLRGSGIPHIEVHAQPHAANDAVGQPLRVIEGYGAQGYVLGLSMALEHLGCADCENERHVGT